jgi:CelD/BcsL family acetyltransferase involved in cellulose biosynthesis
VLALKEPIERIREAVRAEAMLPVSRPRPDASVIDATNRLTLELFETMEPLVGEWRLLERDPLNSLHHGWDWCQSWVKAKGRPLAILRGERAGRTLFLLPLDIHRSQGVRVARFVADDFSNLNTGLISAAFRRGDAIADGKAFAETVAQLLSGRADLLALRNLPRHGQSVCGHWRGGEPQPQLPASAARFHGSNHQAAQRQASPQEVPQPAASPGSTWRL